MTREDRGRLRVLLLHGWGFGPGVWDALAARFEGQADIVAPALPGYGDSGAGSAAEPLGRAGTALLKPGAAPAVVVAWSYGALLAIRLACSRPERVRALVLIAGLPRFRRGPGWPGGIAPAGIAAVRRRLQADPAAALEYVAALCARGDRVAGRVRRSLLAAVPAGPPVAALTRDLDQLATADLRAVDLASGPPVHLVLGARDHVIGADSAVALRQWCPRAQLHVLPDSGHAPMISRTESLHRLLCSLP